MAYTTPTQRTTGTLITSSIYNTDIIDNITFFGVTHDHNGDSGDGGTIATIPANLIAHTTSTTAPTGWAEYTAGRGRVIVGTVATSPTHGGTVGSAMTDLLDVGNHSHSGPSHSHETNFARWSSIEDSAFNNTPLFGQGTSRTMSHRHVNGGADATARAVDLTQAAGTGATGATSATMPYIQQLGIIKS